MLWDASGRAKGSHSTPNSALALEQACSCCSWTGLQMSSLSHRLCPQRTIVVLGYCRKWELCGSPVILNIILLQQRMSPPKSVPKALCDALFWGAWCGTREQLLGCWRLHAAGWWEGCAGAPSSAEHGASAVTCGSEENIAKGKI